MQRVFIGIGSNVGDRQASLDLAHRRMGKLSMTSVVAISPAYETDPIGVDGQVASDLGHQLQSKYLNAVAELATKLLPLELLDELQKIETEAGRLPESQRGICEPRSLDLDILLYGDLIISDDRLSVPHPLLHERWFVLRPLVDIDASVVHPLLQMTAGTLLDSVPHPVGIQEES